jgi:hypothetical protein
MPFTTEITENTEEFKFCFSSVLSVISVVNSGIDSDNAALMFAALQ